MVRDSIREVRTYVFEAKAIDEEFGELENPREEAANIRKEGRIVLALGHQLVVLAHHGDAGSRRHADRFSVAEHLNKAANEGHGFAVVAGVVVHLAATRLLNGEDDGVAEAFEEARNSDARLGEERVVVAGDKERDLQAKSPLFR